MKDAALALKNCSSFEMALELAADALQNLLALLLVVLKSVHETLRAPHFDVYKSDNCEVVYEEAIEDEKELLLT